MTTTRAISKRLRWLGVVVALAAVYAITSRLGLLLALPPEKKATAVWPPSGIALAALLLLGRRAWPGVWVGAFAGNLWDYLGPANPFPLTSHLAVSAGIATGSTLQAVVGSALLARWTGTTRPFDRAAHAFLFAAVAMLMCLIAATFGVTSLCLAGFAPPSAAGFIWWTWWLGDMTGVLTVGSLLLTWRHRSPLAWSPLRLAEAGLLLMLLLGVGSAIFGLVTPFAVPPPLAYLVLPLLVWATFRFGLHGAATALVLASAVAVAGTARGTGPFAQPTVAASLLLLQVFMGVVSVTTLVMAAVLAELQAALAGSQKAQTALAESEKRLRLLLGGVPQLVWTCLLDGRCDYLSPQWVEYTGRPEADQLGYGWSDAVHPDDRGPLLAAWNRAVETGGRLDVEFRIRRHDGEYRWFRTRAVLFDPGDGSGKWFGTNTDVNDLKLAEVELKNLNATLERRVLDRTRELQESERRFRAIFHSQFQFIGLMAPTGEVIEANRTALAAAGVAEEAVLGRPFWETAWWTHDPGQQDRLRAAVRRAAGGARVRFEASHPTAAGGLMWVDFSLTPFLDDAGAVVLLIPEGRDITERKRAEEALRLQEERFRSAFDHAPIGVALVAPDGRWLRVNRSVCEMLGYPEAELLALDFQTITHPDDLDADLAFVRQVLAGTITTYQMEKRYFHKLGHLVHALLSVSLVRDGDGAPLYFISQIKDITQRKEAEDRVKASLREKEVLLKEIHHRVKNNLQIVSTLLDLQADHTQDPQALEMFRESRGRVRSMALIHERLYRSQDLARVNFGEYVRQLADDLFRAYKVSGDDVGLHVEVTVPPLPIDVAIPCGLLLNELMSNCFKHAFADRPDGWVRVTLTGDDRANVLTVADNGVGFPPGFDFRDTASFGLQLVNTLVEQLSGTIELTTRPGSEFVVTFPNKHHPVS